MRALTPEQHALLKKALGKKWPRCPMCWARKWFVLGIHTLPSIHLDGQSMNPDSLNVAAFFMGRAPTLVVAMGCRKCCHVAFWSWALISREKEPTAHDEV